MGGRHGMGPEQVACQGVSYRRECWYCVSGHTVCNLMRQADLEESTILRGLPIVLSRIDVHALWVSRAVLDAMGDLPDHVHGGQIVRDEAGLPTGVFVSASYVWDPRSDRNTDRVTGRQRTRSSQGDSAGMDR